MKTFIKKKKKKLINPCKYVFATDPIDDTTTTIIIGFGYEYINGEYVEFPITITRREGEDMF